MIYLDGDLAFCPCPSCRQGPLGPSGAPCHAGGFCAQSLQFLSKNRGAHLPLGGAHLPVPVRTSGVHTGGSPTIPINGAL